MVSKVIKNLPDVSNAFWKKILVDNFPDVQQTIVIIIIIIIIIQEKKVKQQYKLCVDNDMLGENSNLD